MFLYILIGSLLIIGMRFGFLIRPELYNLAIFVHIFTFIFLFMDTEYYEKQGKQPKEYILIGYGIQPSYLGDKEREELLFN